MVIVQLAGGLGNQLSQYAFGYNLARINQTDLFIDTGFFDTYDWHDFSMNPLSISAKQVHIASTPTWARSRWTKQFMTMARVFSHFFPNYVRWVLDTKIGHYTPNVLRKYASQNLYVQGYWQSEQYFTDIRNELLREFHIKVPPSLANQALLDQIQSTNAVSLHVRRGNYVSIAKVAAVHGTCTIEYYVEAVALIASRVKNPTFFVFSDSIDWAKENVKLSFPTVYVDCNDAAHDYEDLRLMQHCQHNIIANSTFSWWAAWLNQHPGKIVIAPKRWFNDPKKPTQDIVPAEWVRL